MLYSQINIKSLIKIKNTKELLYKRLLIRYRKTDTLFIDNDD